MSNRSCACGRAVLTILFMLMGSSIACTAAQPAEDAFKGKTINIIVAAGEGAGSISRRA